MAHVSASCVMGFKVPFHYVGRGFSCAFGGVEGADVWFGCGDSSQSDVDVGRLRHTVGQDSRDDDTPAVQSDLSHVHQRTAPA